MARCLEGWAAWGGELDTKGGAASRHSPGAISSYSLWLCMPSFPWSPAPTPPTKRHSQRPACTQWPPGRQPTCTGARGQLRASPLKATCKTRASQAPRSTCGPATLPCAPGRSRPRPSQEAHTAPPPLLNCPGSESWCPAGWAVQGHTSHFPWFCFLQAAAPPPGPIPSLYPLHWS